MRAHVLAAALCAVASVLLGGTACVRSLDPAKVKCLDDKTCPAGYTCEVLPTKSSGTCIPRTIGSTDATDEPRTDGSAGVTSSGGAGSPPNDGGGGGAGGSTSPGGVDAPGAIAGKSNGESCAGASDCQSGKCADGICCETDCAGACYSCAQLYTGKPDGTCAVVGAGKKDPRATCVDETSGNECGNDGTCDGAGACRKVGTDHVCATASCNGSTFTPTSTCDGHGACKTVLSTDCGAAPCDVVDGCRASCATDKDCPATSYCNSTTQRCAAKRITGDSCTAVNECSSGFCVDGVCCNKVCTGKCMACSGSMTTEKSGICSAVKVGTDPHDSCEVDTTNDCGADGTCDGVGACRMTGTDHVCVPSACDNGTFVNAATCDGKGACGTPVSESCGAFTCSASTGCQKACAKDTDCTGASYCDITAKTCAAKKANGNTCASGQECIYGNCVDGMCCNSKCDGLCSSCKKAHTNVADGTCAVVSSGQDPYNSCQDQTATNPCGDTGLCDGAGACQKVDKTKSCGNASCSGATYTPASMCDGLGTCKASSATNCGDYQCSPSTGCLTTCASNSDCSSATYCDLSLAKPVCTAKKAPGAACGTDASKCTTGRCVDGVCCNTDCTSSCYACNLTGKEGTCTAVPNGGTDSNGTCKASGTACGQDGTCDGNGGCRYPATGTTCASSTCQGSTLTTNSCNAAHSCAPTSSSCKNLLMCNASMTDCLTSCTVKADCTGTNQCNTSTKTCVLCTPKARDCTSASDNDCNGTPDNQEAAYCTCKVGDSQPCQTHPGLDGKGICKAGSQTCVASADKTTSAWGTCSGSVGPSPEICDASARDEDCNNMSNEGCGTCAGVSGGWVGCRGSGCSACLEKLTEFPLYFAHHPYCLPNSTCNNTGFATCSENCPAPTDADRAQGDICAGAANGWTGCRGSGCWVCQELLTAYPRYIANHPSCTLSTTCGGQFFTCGSVCPVPTENDR
jgi:hypothetical protein